MAKRWYVIHTQTGYEDKVKSAIENKLKLNEEMSVLITKVLVPTEKISEIRAGKKRVSERKFFPGYILIEMDMTDKSWYFIKGIAGITGFVGPGARPIPLKQSEVDSIIKQQEAAKEKPMPKVLFDKGEAVRVKEGPFINFNGTVEETNLAKGKVKVSISIFGRSTPVELEAWQVEKV